MIGRLLADRPGIIATGGGAFIEPGTRAEIMEHGRSVWLRAEVDVLWERVRDRPGRPLLATSNPRATLADLLERRAPIYALADVIVDSRRGVSPDGMARSVIEAVQATDARHPHAIQTMELLA